MENAIGALIIFSVVVLIAHDHRVNHNDVGNGTVVVHVKASAFGKASTRHTATVDSSAGSIEMIRQASAIKGVPAGLIYGHWTMESGRLEGAYSDEDNWYTVSQLTQGDKCASRFSAKYCQESLRLMTLICEQRQANGQKVCDIDAIKVGISYDMGPMQITPQTMAFVKKDGSLGLTGVATDCDGDGVVNPFSRADSFCTAAALSRLGYDQRGSWLGAINRYRGKDSATYRAKVLRSWTQWCSTYGCDGDKTIVATK